METVDISFLSLMIAFILFIIPVVLSLIFRLKLIKPLMYSTIRMSVQLALIGIFLKYLFEWNNTGLNILWLTVMILVAVISTVRDSSMHVRKILLPVFIAFSLATFLIVLFLNSIVIRLDRIFDARYLVVLGGMLLGNSLRGNIIGITAFYRNIKKDHKKFLYTLSLGASFQEAVLPYLQDSMQLALKPTIAAMATMGIVALPGMMTGVILGGTSPDVAIKYQIMIMIAIVVSTISSVFLTIVMTMHSCFTPYGILKSDIFSDQKASK
jgi:putative ABC transport system permease protein